MYEGKLLTLKLLSKACGIENQPAAAESEEENESFGPHNHLVKAKAYRMGKSGNLKDLKSSRDVVHSCSWGRRCSSGIAPLHIAFRLQRMPLSLPFHVYAPRRAMRL